METGRLAQLAAILQERGIDAFFAQTPVSLGYLAGFPEDAHERFMTLGIHISGETRLICPALSRIQADRAGIQNIVSWRDGEDPLALFGQLSEEWNLRTAVCVVDDHMPAKMVLEMQSVAPTCLFKPGGDVIAELMSKKDDHELELMRRAAKIADSSYELAMRSLHTGMTELELQDVIQNNMRDHGAKPAFCIVGFGPGAAESHHINGDTALKPNTLVLIDLGCSVEGYFSDITRTFFYGVPNAKHHEVYSTVYNAHQAAVAAGRSGVTGKEVDHAARKTIAEAGYGEFFTHRTGHGIGAQVHEAPYISSDNDKELEDHNCFSIEPGIYLPNEFGVRLENLYYAKGNGLVSFNAPIPSTLLQVAIK